MKLPGEHNTAAPVVVLGAPGSGASAVTAMLVEGAGFDPGETVDATPTQPFGSLDHVDLSEAGRTLLARLDRDWTCPPTSFDPAALDLTHLESVIGRMGADTIVKAPALAFVLPALASAGLQDARLVLVVRAVPDTIASLSQRGGISEYDAEAIVDAYYRRLGAIARRCEVAVVEFSADSQAFVEQVGRVARQLGGSWDLERGAQAFDQSLIVNRSPHQGHAKTVEAIIHNAAAAELESVPNTPLADCIDLDGPEWPLSLHCGPQRDNRAAAMWRLASPSNGLTTAEISSRTVTLPYGVPGHGTPTRLPVSRLDAIAQELVRAGVRPDRLVLPGFLDGASAEAVGFVLTELHQVTPLFAELIVDLTEADADAPTVVPASPETVDIETVRSVADSVGWTVRDVASISSDRVGVRLRRAATDDGSGQLGADELARQVEALEAMVGSLREDHRSPAAEAPVGDALDEARRRADRAERTLDQLTANPVVRVAMVVSRPARRARSLLARLRRAAAR